MARSSFLLIVLSFTLFTILFAQGSEDLIVKELDTVFAQNGKAQSDGVMKYSWPRKDLKVRVDEVEIETGLALTSWAAFKKNGSNEVMAMGDLVLLSQEVNPVIRKLQSGAIEILAVHNHLFGESPQIIYVHFSGHGAAKHLAQVLKDALAKTSAPKPISNATKASTDPAMQDVFEKIQEQIGRKGNAAGKMLQINVPRTEMIHEGDEVIPPSMGMSSVMNFQIVGDRVATTGDFVLLADEVNPVIKELQVNGIEITALHSHMLRKTPRLFFMHFWALDSPEKISSGLKAALSQVKRDN